MLSIATVVLNDPVGIKRTIDSVKYHKERGVKIQFLVADGGSEESTLNIAYENRDIIDVFINGPDEGIYDGMNKLLKAANGISIIFINAGDRLSVDIDLNFIMKHYDLKKNNYYGRVLQYFKDDYFLRERSLHNKVKLKDISHQAFFVPKIIYKNTLYDLNYWVSSDRFWINECVQKGKTFYIDEVISIFELGGISNSSSLKSLYSKLREKSSTTKKCLQLIKLILRVLSSQSLYYRIIYYFKYKHFKKNIYQRDVKL